MNASSDLITKLEEMMRTLSAAEAARIIVEAARQAAEEARRQSERQRIQAEIDRNIAEELRQSTQKMRDLAQIERNKSDLLCHLCEQVPAQTDDQRQRHEAQYRAPRVGKADCICAVWRHTDFGEDIQSAITGEYGIPKPRGKT